MTRIIKFKMIFRFAFITLLCLLFCACRADDSETVAPEYAALSEELDVLSVEKALELVRIEIGHEDAYVPIRKNSSGDSMFIGDVYSVNISGDQTAVILLYNYNYAKEELDSEWFFFHLETYFIDDMGTGAWHTSSLNDYAVNKNTGEIIARIAPDGMPNKVPGSPYWRSEDMDAAN